MVQVSFDGGTSWSKIRDTNANVNQNNPALSTVPQTFPGDTSRGKLLDPNLPPPSVDNQPSFTKGYTNVSGPTIAFARSGAIYVAYLEHNLSMTSGALVVERFDVTRGVTTLPTGYTVPAGAVFPRDTTLNGQVFRGGVPTTFDVTLFAPATVPADSIIPYDLDRARDWDDNPATPSSERWQRANGTNNLAAVLYQWVDNGTVINRPLNPYIAVDTSLPTFTDPATGEVATSQFVDQGGGGDTVFIAWNMQATTPTINGSLNGLPAGLNYNANAIMMAVGRLDPLAQIDRPDPDAPEGPNNQRQAAFLFSTPVPVNDGVTGTPTFPGGGHFLWSPNVNTGGAAPVINFAPPVINGNGTATPGRMTITWSTTGGQIAQSAVAYGPGPASASYTFRSNDLNQVTGKIADGFDIANDNPDSDAPGVTTFNIPVSFLPFSGAGGFTTLDDLDVTVALSHPNLNHLRIVLVAPNGTRVVLVRNKINSQGQTITPGVIGLTGADLGVAQGVQGNEIPNTPARPGNVVGTTFSQEAARQINDPTNPANYIGSYRPDGDSLAALYGLTAAQLGSGVWQLEITDVRDDRQSFNNAPVDPIQFLRYWSMTFTSRVDNDNAGGRAGADTFVTNNSVASSVGGGGPRIATVPFGAAQTYPRADAASPTFGVGPGVSVAYDNSLGSFSRFAGRMYLAYTATSVNAGTSGPTAVTNTNIFLIYSDNNGASWSRPVQVNDDVLTISPPSSSDNFSEGRRTQFQPTVTVDPATGTVVVMWYDARVDASGTRVATYVSTSIDGGNTFSQSQAVNTKKFAIDAITGNKVELEAIPTNMSGFTTFNGGTVIGGVNFQYGGSGLRQSVVAYGGVIRPFWIGNLNSTGSAVFTSTVRTTAGPRVFESDMGAVTELSLDGGFQNGGSITLVDENGLPSPITDAFGNSRSTYNDTFTPDGTRQMDGFRVVFDRPVYFGPNATTPDLTGEGFGVEDVDVRFRGTTGALTTATQGAQIPLQGVRPIGGYSVDGSFFATAFFVQFRTPQSAVGTYSYSVGPGVFDRIRSTSTAVFAAADTPQVLADPGITESSIIIPPLAANPTVQNVTVGLNISHTFLADLIVTLIAPDGTEIVLVNQEGLDNNDIVNMRIEDNGIPSPYPISVPFDNFNGIYAPYQLSDPLDPRGLVASLAGKPISGTWRLRVEDVFGTDTGVLNAWTLTFRDTAGNPVTISRTGNGMDQDADARQQEPENDVYSAPGSTAGAPFTGPYDTTTQPVVLPGTHVVRTYAGGQFATATSAVVSTFSPNILEVTLDREVDINTLTLAGIVSVMGPNGAVTPTGIFPNTAVDGGTKSFFLSFGSALPNGDYRVSLNNTIYVVDDTVLNSTTGEVYVRFDRDINPASFTPANVLRMTGPIGNLSLTGVTVTPVGENRAPLAGATAARLFRVTFNPVQLSGPYTIEFGSNPAEQNQALAAIRGVDRPQLVTAQPTPTTSIVIPVSAVAGALALSDVVRVTGPNGPVSLAGAVLSGPAAPLPGDPPGTVARYTLTFVSQLPAGQYIVDFDPTAVRNIHVAGSGSALDSNFNAGLDLLTGRAPSGAEVGPRTFPSASSPVPIDPAVLLDNNGTPSDPSDDRIETTVTEMPITVNDDFIITQDSVNRIQVLLNINYPNVYNLTIELVPPATTNVGSILLYNGADDRPANAPGASGGANFINTLLVDRVGDPLRFPSILNGTAPFSSQPGFGYTPQNPLSILVDPAKPVSARGTWTLRVTNRGTAAVAGTAAQITNWTLTLPRAEPGSGLGERVADRFQAGFRVYTQDPTNGLSHNTWTPVGPSSANEGTNTGRVTAVAVDPSDPSGNTVYVAGASGGVWKTTNFLTTDVDGPHYVPLTDFGPTNSLNIQSLALFPRNNDPGQTIIFALTGEGNTEGIVQGAYTSAGVGLLRSMDGGRTWTVLDSTDNRSTEQNAPPGTAGKVSDPGRDHRFAGATGYKVLVDPNPAPDGGVIVYMALTGAPGQAGVWRSRDGGLTWFDNPSTPPAQRQPTIRAGAATDIVLAAGSANTVNPVTGATVANGNLQYLYAAFRGEGVFFTPTAPSAVGMTLMNGAGGLPSTADINAVGTPVVTVQNNPSPSGNQGRIAIAAPALTNDPLRNSFYKDWLYAVVITPNGGIAGVYQTKDHGVNWTLIQIPAYRPTASTAFPTNDETQSSYDPTGFAQFGLGNYDVSISVDPQNPSIVYLAGLGQGGVATPTGVAGATPAGGSIRLDLTTIRDTQNFTFYNNSDAGGGFQTATTGGAVARTNAPAARGAVYRGGTFNTYSTDFINLSRDPANPFVTNSTLRVSNIGSVANSGVDVSWSQFNDILNVGTNIRSGKSDPNGGAVQNERAGNIGIHNIFPLIDPVSGQTRLIYSGDFGISTGVDAGNGTLATSLGFTSQATGTRNGNLQLAQFYSGAVQPSQLAADIAGAMFYGMADANGFLVSSADALGTGNADMRGPVGDGAWVEVDASGTGTSFQLRSPINAGLDNNVTALPKDFFRVFAPGLDPEFSGGVGQTFGLIQGGDNPGTNTGQWPAGSSIFGFTFAVNPINPNALVIVSRAGRVFRTVDQGTNWIPIGEPNQLDGTRPGAQAFGATDPSNQRGPNDFIYVGTAGGNMFVTTTGGSAWTNVSAGLDGSPIRRIVPNPAAGSREVYIVTNGGVYYKADGTSTAPWTDITQGLFNITRAAFGDAQDQVPALPPQAEARLPGNPIRAINALAVDWRFTNTASGPGAPATVPDLYVGGVGGVYKSSDFGATWRLFPSMAADGAPADGGYMPTIEVTDLDLSIGNLNRSSGRYEAGGLNLLLASTYGRGSWAIRLGTDLPPETFISGPRVTAVSIPAQPTGTGISVIEVQFSGPVDPATIRLENFRLQILDGAGVPTGDVPILSVTQVTTAGAANRYAVRFQERPQSTTQQYRLTVGNDATGAGIPTITDPAGNRMNQDADTTNGEAFVDQFVRQIVLDGVSSGLTVTASPATLTAGTLGTVTIEQRRADGTLDTTANAALIISSSGPGAVQLFDMNGNPITSVSLVAGVARFQIRLTTAGTYPFQVMSSAMGVNPTGFTTLVTAAAAASVTLSPVSPTVAVPGQVTYTVSFTDQFGNPTDYTGTATVTYTGAAVNPTSPTTVSVNTAGGANSFTVTTQQAGAVGVTVSLPRPAGAPGTGPLTATSTINATPGPSSGVTVTTVGTGPFAVGSPITVTVRVTDANGNLVSSVNGPVTVNIGDPTGTVTPTTVTMTGGVATFTVRYSAAGTFVIAATVPGGLTGQSGPITVNPQPPRPSPTQGLPGVYAAATGVDGTPVVTVYRADGTPLTSLNPFPPGFGGEVDAGSPGFTGGIRMSVADVTGDGVPDYVVGSGPTITATVLVIDGTTNRTILTLRPFETFTGGVFVSTGDVDGDGIADIVMTPDQGGGPRVTIVRGGNFRQLANFLGIDDVNFRGGARAALGDVNADGFADLVVSAGFGGGPRISIYDGAALRTGAKLNVIGDFFLFEPALRNGAYVAVGDVNGDGFADIIGGAGPGGGPRVLVLDSATLLSQGVGAALNTPLFNSFLGDVDNRGGVRVAAKNLDNDRFTDILIGAGEGGGSRVEAYRGSDFGLLQSFDLLPGYTGGVFVG
ncbi:proprotein convertase P-domain-containing protein [bacterium]|nr:proprotein convertase P-domain-containing protein [bacterium]